MHAILPVLSTCPFVDTHPCVDTYSIFCIESIHGLLLGVGKLRKNCLFNLFGDPGKTSAVMLAMHFQMNLHLEIRKIVLCSMNVFLEKKTKQNFSGPHLPLEFFKDDSGSFVSVKYSENGLAGLLQASDFDSADQISPLLGTVVDTMCGNVE